MIRRKVIGILGIIAIAASVGIACANIRTTLGVNFLIALGLTTACSTFAREGYTRGYTRGRLATLFTLVGIVVTINLGTIQALDALAQESQLTVTLGITCLAAGAIAVVLLVPERIERKVKGLLMDAIHW